jgi:hypothetical protein
VEGKLWRRLIEVLPETDGTELKACMKSEEPSNLAIKTCVASGGGAVKGALVRKECHLRVE